MIKPPSSRLVQRLTELRLCRKADLRRCRRRVKQLARDLPAFDSVWIDALLQDRKLTPFQARLLESPPPERLSVGPCVLVDQLGGGPHGETFLVRIGNGKQRSVLKLVSGGVVSGEWSSRPPLTTHHSPLTALQSLVSRAGGERHPHVVTPEKVLVHDGRLLVLSRFVAGTPLTELLIRRGRFPVDVVRHIGRQLVAGLAFLESRKIVHGEIALWNVRLSSQGIATLVDAGIAPVIRPEVLIDPDIAPERFDGVAPERVTTGNPATTASDVYALGCLLWQLLAGRPPFPTGDPLTKLAHHQTRPVADVREWVPDCPDSLAELLLTMTAFDPRERPASFAELAGRWQSPTGQGRRRLRRFHSSFRAAVPRIRLRPAGAGFVKRTLTACVVLAGVAVGVGLMDRDFRGPLLNIATPVTDRLAALTGSGKDAAGGPGNVNTDLAPVTNAKPQALGLPVPDAGGVIQLASGTVYEWTTPIRSDRPIAIRGGTGKPAVVIVGTRGGFVSAPEVLLENVRLVVRAKPQAGGRESAAMLTVQSDRLSLVRCAIQIPVGATGFEWKPLTATNRATGIAFKDTVIAGGAVVARLGTSPSAVRCENVLHLGPGELFRFATLPPAGVAVNVTLANVTQRNATALLRVDLPLGNAPARRVMVSAKNCVFHYAGKNAALCLFGTAFPGQIPRSIVQFSGEGSLFPPGGRIAVEAAVGPASPARVDDEAVQIDGGLLAGPFEFAGPAGADPATSVIAKHRAPVRSQHQPGIDARRLMAIRAN